MTKKDKIQKKNKRKRKRKKERKKKDNKFTKILGRSTRVSRIDRSSQIFPKSKVYFSRLILLNYAFYIIII